MSELDDLRYALLTHSMTRLSDEAIDTDTDVPPEPVGASLEKAALARAMGKTTYDPAWDELLGGGSGDTLHKRDGSENSVTTHSDLSFRFGSNAEPIDAPTVNLAAPGGDSLAKRMGFTPNWDFSDIAADSEIGKRRRAEEWEAVGEEVDV